MTKATELAEVLLLQLALEDIVRMVPLLEEARYNPPKVGGGGDRVATSNLVDVASQWSQPAAELLGDIDDWAGYLGRTLIELGDKTARAGDRRRQLLLAAQTKQAKALLAHPVIDDILTETLALRDRAQRLLGGETTRHRRTESTCNAVVVIDDGEQARSYRCGGALTLVYDGPRSLIVCARDASHASTFDEITPPTNDAYPWLTVQESMILLGLSDTRVRSLARDDKWRVRPTLSLTGSPMFATADVVATRNRRAAAVETRGAALFLEKQRGS